MCMAETLQFVVQEHSLLSFLCPCYGWDSWSWLKQLSRTTYLFLIIAFKMVLAGAFVHTNMDTTAQILIAFLIMGVFRNLWRAGPACLNVRREDFFFRICNVVLLLAAVLVLVLILYMELHSLDSNDMKTFGITFLAAWIAGHALEILELVMLHHQRSSGLM